MAWLKSGDRNTSFFHSKATIRNFHLIERLKDDRGLWVSGDEEVVQVVEGYFKEVFRSSRPSEVEIRLALQFVDTSLSENQSLILDVPFSASKVKQAVFDMGSLKAPGPYGFSVLFYQKYWGMVGGEVTRECLRVLSEESSIGEPNLTQVDLIPKKKDPIRVADYRSISLCNVIYKMDTKTLANHLKLVLLELISCDQSTFVPDRLIIDNRITAFEVLHS